MLFCLSAGINPPLNPAVIIAPIAVVAVVLLVILIVLLVVVFLYVHGGSISHTHIFIIHVMLRMINFSYDALI